MSSENFNNETEILCGFSKENLKYFHTGNISSYIFPVTHSKAHKDKIPHIIIRIFVKSIDGMYLVQKRSKNKRVHSERWTDSASGHVQYKENFTYEDIETNVQRELMEEMGTKLLSLRFIGLSLAEIEDDDCELCYVYLGITEDQISLDLTEVDEKSGFYTKEGLSKILKEERTAEKKPWVEVSREYWIKIINGTYDYVFNQMLDEIHERSSLNSPVDNKKKGIGFVVGRFQPLHKGHVQLLNRCFDYVQTLKIGIGSSQFSDDFDNPFSFDERKLFIELALSDLQIHPQSYQIFAIPDKFDISQWIDEIMRVVGHFDIIFTNNLWIGRLFQLKQKRLIYGIKFDFEKYNGTNIRTLIYNKKPQWMDLIPRSVYRYIAQPEVLKRMKKISRSS